ncbi:baculoviral IAP repeat-containing protein 5.2-A [Condylostylus longicornis]|uniref:baculoviral IAP repeat-containing protein 5.2-A n=1 Tax=Condylostylus longicornis TaxID=2530218 RepID=UPI00244DCE4F|nr:baculoviral IAP repeat-containing protein 5.2-A [Condylostylus longicornis]
MRGLIAESAKILKIFEKSRVESFVSWPYEESTTCDTRKMAEAGFYWTGNGKGDDTTTCFACGKMLDGWEATDDPWLEHKKHAPQCCFVKLGKPERMLTKEEFLDLSFNVLLFSIQRRKDHYQRKLKIEVNKERDKFVSAN